MIDIPALLAIAVGYVLCVVGVAEPRRGAPSEGNRREGPDPDGPPEERAWEAAHDEAGPWVLAAGVTNLLAGAVLFGMPAGGPRGTVLVLAGLLTAALLGVAARTGWRAAERDR